MLATEQQQGVQVQVTCTPHNAAYIRTLLRAAAAAGQPVHATATATARPLPDGDPAAALVQYTYTLHTADTTLRDEVLGLNETDAYTKAYNTVAVVAAMLCARRTPNLPCNPVDAVLAWLAAPPNARHHLVVTAADQAAAQAYIAQVARTPGAWQGPLGAVTEEWLAAGELPQLLCALR